MSVTTTTMRRKDLALLFAFDYKSVKYIHVYECMICMSDIKVSVAYASKKSIEFLLVNYLKMHVV